MKFDTPLNHAILIKRYKRFLADITLPDDNQVTIHVANTSCD
jgi:sugar fermentation stimulation protein A